MDTFFPVWNTEADAEFALPGQRKLLGVENELVELLWQNGGVVLHSQTRKKQNNDPTKFKQVYKHEQSTSRALENTNNSIQDDETVSWIHCPIDEFLDEEFHANILSSNPVEADKLSGRFEGENGNFGASDPDYAPVLLPDPRLDPFDAIQHHRNMEGKENQVRECSVMTIEGSSHCASNHVANEVQENCAQRSTGREPLEQAIMSSSSSLWKTNNQSNDSRSSHKRKRRDMEESECQSDATEFESAAGNKSSRKSGATRRSRVAEVHNLSERRRRDRINEKLRILQELIPYSTKSDKASMLDEAIEYMKSLQLQLQLMWMGSGMAPMMLTGIPHCMSQMGMGIRPPMLPAMQNLMHHQAVNTAPVPNQATLGQSRMMTPINYQNHSIFPEQYASEMVLHSTQNTAQPMNMFGLSPRSAQQTHVLAPPGNGNGSNACL